MNDDRRESHLTENPIAHAVEVTNFVTYCDDSPVFFAYYYGCARHVVTDGAYLAYS